MPPDPRSGRKGALTVWQVDEITLDRAREEASFAKVQSAIAYLDSAPAGFFTSDADGKIEYLNATLAQWLGLDLSEVANAKLKLSKIMSPDSSALISRAGRGSVQGGTRRFDVDLVKSDGTSLPVRILHRLAARRLRLACACAGAEPRTRRGGRGGRVPTSDLRGCFTRRPSPSPRSMRKASSARPTPPSSACSATPRPTRAARRASKAWSSATAIRRFAARSMPRSPARA